MRKKSIILLCLTTIVAIVLNLFAFFGTSLVGGSYKGVLDEETGIRRGIDLAGGAILTFEANTDKTPTLEEMNTVEAIFNTRLTNAGLTEARVSTSDDGQITVEIPAVTNGDEAKELLGATAQLQFKDADGNVIAEGSDVKSAEYQYGTVSDASAKQEAYVSLTFNDEGRQKFTEATKAAASKSSEGKNYIAIMMDDVPVSQPRVDAKYASTGIDSESCIISGEFTAESAKMLANQINSGSLPFDLKCISTQTVGAELGDTALPTSLLAAGIGILLIFLFMLFMYRLPGLMADIALAIYIAIVCLILGVFHVNLSISGIAGIVLSIGMAVDANVIIFERMKEEMKLGKTVKAGVDAGFNKAFTAIIDSNVTTIITCVVLYLSKISAVTGFAITLGIGVIVSMFTAIFVTKFLMKQLVGCGIVNRSLFYAVKKSNEGGEQ